MTRHPPYPKLDEALKLSSDVLLADVLTNTRTPTFHRVLGIRVVEQFLGTRPQEFELTVNQSTADPFGQLAAVGTRVLLLVRPSGSCGFATGSSILRAIDDEKSISDHVRALVTRR